MKKGNMPIGLVIGRFQPFHNAHLKLVRFALAKYDRVIVLVGSYRQARDTHNPFSYDERKSMILLSLTKEEQERIFIRPVRDYSYNDNLWITEVQRVVDEITEESVEVRLIGHSRDSSSYYLKMFPQWGFEETGKLDGDISASEVRTAFMTNNLESFPTTLCSKLPPAVVSFMREFHRTEDYAELVEEYKVIQNYKAAWNKAPYPPTFVTTDAVCLRSGHVLLVRRKAAPGKNLLAFPGGYIKQDETLVEGMLRELKEETAIGIPKDQLQKAIVAQRVFDSPWRDLRGRVITHAYCINLGNGPLPKVRGGDDATHAFWMPLHEAFANDNAFFADHWHILNVFSSNF